MEMSWKPISELPPRELIGETVLVLDDRRKFGGREEVTLGYCWRGNGPYFDPDGSIVTWDTKEDRAYTNITHWMPLPNPLA